jgi:hypothetical protein
MNDLDNFDDELTIENITVLESNEIIGGAIDHGYISYLNTEESDTNEDISKLTFSSGIIYILLFLFFIY